MLHFHGVLILKFLRFYWISFFSKYFIIEEQQYTNMYNRKQGRLLSVED